MDAKTTPDAEELPKAHDDVKVPAPTDTEPNEPDGEAAAGTEPED